MSRKTSAIIPRRFAKKLLEIKQRQLDEYTERVHKGLYRVTDAQESLRDHERLLGEAESILEMMEDGMRGAKTDTPMSETDVAIPFVVAESLVETTRKAHKHLTEQLGWDRKELAEAERHVEKHQRQVEDASESIAILERALTRISHTGQPQA